MGRLLWNNFIAMAESSNHQRLKATLIDMSESKEWNFAKAEWGLERIYVIEDWEELDACSCGKYPIKEVCIISNSKNHNTAIVWNCCVKKFLEHIDTWNVVEWLTRIIKNPELWPSESLIEYCYINRIIDDWEYKYCKDRYWTKKASQKQLARRVIINKKIIQNLKK